MTRTGRWGMWAILMGLVMAGEALAGEVRFVASQIAADRAIWQPSLVLIDNTVDLEGGLVFVLENGTADTHVFVVEGLSEIVGEEPRADQKGNGAARALSVTVAPHEVKRVRIVTAPLTGDRARGKRFKVTCPIHAVGHLPGAIYVVSGSFLETQ